MTFNPTNSAIATLVDFTTDFPGASVAVEGFLTEDPLLAPYYIGDAKLAVDEGNKMAVIKQVMTYPQLTNLKIEHASLEQLYQHYLAQGHQSSAAVKAVASTQAVVTGVAV